MKTHLALLCILCLQPCLHAQVTPPSRPDPDKTELMLRRLREALTNAPAAKPETRPAMPAPAATMPSAIPRPSSVAPSTATAVRSNVPTPTAVPSQPTVAPVASPAAQPSPTPLPGAVPPGTAVVVRTNTIAPTTTQPAAGPGAVAPRPRPAPIRRPTALPPQPGASAPAAAALPPGVSVNLPGMAAPAAAGAEAAAPAPPPVTVSSAYDPNEIISAGTIQVQEMDPSQFFDSVYAPISGRTVIRGANLQGVQKITLKAATDWTRQEAVFAMDAMMAQNNIAMIPIGDKFVKAVPIQQAAQEGAQPTTVTSEDYAAAEPFITQVIQLKVVKPTELQQLLSTFTKSPQGITAFDATQTLVIRDYASNVKRMMEIIKKVDVPEKEPDYHLEAIPVKYGKVIDLYNTMEALISGSGVPTSSAAGGMQGGGNQRSRYGGTSSRFGGMSGRSGSQYGGGGGYGGSYGRNYGGYGSGSMYPYEESVERMSALQVTTPQPAATGARTSAGAAQSTFQNRLSQIARRAATGADEEIQVLEDARIVPDERSNKLLVFANKRDMEMITNIVSKVDVLLAQVLIEAVIMEVRLGDSQKLGVSWAQRPKRFGQDFSGAGAVNNGQGFLNSVTNFPGTVGQGFSYFGAINDQWDVVVNAVAEDSSINVVSRPRIQTSHAIPGSFFVGETVPYITGFTDYGGYNTGLATRSVVQQANVGFSLFVTPFITPDGLVVMEISQEFSTRGRDVLIDDNPVPIINGRNAESTLTVRDGDTIMMGGFITETQSRAKSGVPFLKDIPGVGVLFRSKDNSNDRTELIVLMRARVLRTPEDAAIMATEERSDLPGVMKAEQDLRRANEKRKERSLKPRR